MSPWLQFQSDSINSYNSDAGADVDADVDADADAEDDDNHKLHLVVGRDLRRWRLRTVR